MHILVIALVVIVLAYLFISSRSNTAGVRLLQGGDDLMTRADGLDIAFIADGKLFHRAPGAPLAQVHSSYVEEAEDRRARSAQRHSWKEGTSFNIAAGGNHRNFSSADAQIQVTSATFDARERTLLYFLRDEAVGGLFSWQADSRTEQRILLKQQLSLEDLRLSPDGQFICASSVKSDGTANIVRMNRDGSDLRDLTGGDSIDSAPAWISGVEQRMLFQSCGLARRAEGMVVAVGPATIQMLNTQTGTVSAVLEDEAHDLLNPRVGPGGELLFIRRPYEQLPSYGADKLLLDTVLFPVRLLSAVFHYLNFFSLMYSRKPLTSASGPATQADLKQILLQGKRIDAERALRRERVVHGVPSLVPASWQLVSRSPQGVERVLATNVVSFDVDAAGHIVYSNGRGAFMLAEDGRSVVALKSDLIAEVCAMNLPPASAQGGRGFIEA